MKALPIGHTDRYRQAVKRAGGPRWIPIAELFAFINPNDRTLMICHCHHPDCIEGGSHPS